MATTMPVPGTPPTATGAGADTLRRNGSPGSLHPPAGTGSPPSTKKRQQSPRPNVAAAAGSSVDARSYSTSGATASTPIASLVRYDNPVLVSRVERGEPSALTASSTSSTSSSTHSQAVSPAATAAAAAAARRSRQPQKQGVQKTPPQKDQQHGKQTQQQQQQQDQQAFHHAEDILHSILPPREWEDNGQLWQQRVSSTPATRLDVITLQEQLDMWLQRREARETGICPVRRELYNQCFDELIRQVTISCQERGLLLLRVRDEIRMSIAAYQTLYESSVAFGMRKALMAEWGKADMEQSIKDLGAEKLALETQVAELKAKCEAIEKRESERRAMDERKHAEEIAFMKKTNVQLKTQLESILAPQQRKT